MSMTAKATGGSFENAPAGTYTARCYRLIDLGTQPVDWQGETKYLPKIMCCWELHGDARMQDGRPFSIIKRYTNSLHEKAALRKDLECWRGRPFTADELKGFALKNVLGAYCLIQVIHNEKNGTTYANIGSLMKLPKGMPTPEGINPLVFFNLDEPDMAVFDSFSDKLKDTIRACPEWKHISSPGAMTDDIPGDPGDESEDIPF